MKRDTEMNVGIVGTGMLGGAVALRLLDSGTNVAVFNRTGTKTKEAEVRGAVVCSSPKEVAARSDLVIIVVRDADAVRDVSFGKEGIVEGLHEGLVVADMSTINPADSKKITQEFLHKSVTKLDIPVMGGPDAAIEGRLAVMGSGDRETFERCKSVFDVFADRVFYIGESGTGHSVKLAMNLQITMLALALSEGLVLTKGSGVKPSVFLDVLNSTYFGTGMSKKKAYRMADGSYDATFTLSNLKKDIDTMVETARGVGLDLPMISRAREIYGEAARGGLGEADYTGIIEHIKRMQSDKG